MPRAIRSDNGVPFASPHGLFQLSKLSVWWLRLGISIERIRPGHPQQNGRHVTNCGRICLYRKKINLSKSLAGQAVAIKEVDNGIWLVSFMEYDLGFIDLEEKTLQPLENPFGPKVLPMS